MCQSPVLTHTTLLFTHSTSLIQCDSSHTGLPPVPEVYSNYALSCFFFFFCSLFEGLYTLAPSVWNLFPCLFCFFSAMARYSYFSSCTSSESHSLTIVSKIATPPVFSFTVHSLVISVLSSGSIKVLGT